jgi:hypothetical protein
MVFGCATNLTARPSPLRRSRAACIIQNLFDDVNAGIAHNYSLCTERIENSHSKIMIFDIHLSLSASSYIEMILSA